MTYFKCRNCGAVLVDRPDSTICEACGGPIYQMAPELQDDFCAVMDGPHCICRERGKECCFCDLDRGDCQDA